MNIYISGRISGLTEKEYSQNFAIWEAMLSKKGTTIVNPLRIKPLFGIKQWFFFMAADLWALRKCTHIAMQPNWIDSKGAVIEFFTAKWIFKLKIIFL